MEPRDVALTHARTRIAFGAGLLAFPGLAAGWIGEDASRRPVRVLARALGGRDLALGLGIAIALERGAPVRGWLEGCALADAADLAATALAGDSLPPIARPALMGIAGGSAALCIWLARALDRPPAPGEVHGPEAAITGHPPVGE